MRKKAAFALLLVCVLTLISCAHTQAVPEGGWFLRLAGKAPVTVSTSDPELIASFSAGFGIADTSKIKSITAAADGEKLTAVIETSVPKIAFSAAALFSKDIKKEGKCYRYGDYRISFLSKGIILVTNIGAEAALDILNSPPAIDFKIETAAGFSILLTEPASLFGLNTDADYAYAYLNGADFGLSVLFSKEKDAQSFERLFKLLYCSTLLTSGTEFDIDELAAKFTLTDSLFNCGGLYLPDSMRESLFSVLSF